MTRKCQVRFGGGSVEKCRKVTRHFPTLLIAAFGWAGRVFVWLGTLATWLFSGEWRGGGRCDSGAS